jgi:hypothetical protein
MLDFLRCRSETIQIGSKMISSPFFGGGVKPMRLTRKLIFLQPAVSVGAAFSRD